MYYFVQQSRGKRLWVKTGWRSEKTRPDLRRRPEKGCMARMRKKATRERVIQWLYETALGRANDAVLLAYVQEPTEEYLRKLDLGAVAEFRRSNLGSVEVKFIDRVKALQALAGLLETGGGEAEEFFRAVAEAETEERA